MTRAKAILRDGMEKYDEAEDNVSAYEVREITELP